MAGKNCDHGMLRTIPVTCGFCLEKQSDRRARRTTILPPEVAALVLEVERDADRGIVAPQVVRRKSSGLVSGSSREGICGVCGQQKQVRRIRGTDWLICKNCYKKSKAKVGECARCRKTKVIQAFGLCFNCYQRQRRANMAASPA